MKRFCIYKNMYYLCTALKKKKVLKALFLADMAQLVEQRIRNA